MMLEEYLSHNGIQTEEGHFSMPHAVIQDLADRLGLDMDFEAGDRLEVTTIDGGEIEIVEAVVH